MCIRDRAGRVLQSPQVAQQHPGVGHQLVAEGHGLGTLQVGVAGHDVPCALLGLVAKHGDKFFYLALNMLAGDAQVQADVQRDLIVAAAPGVQALTGVTDAGGQRLLDEGVDVLGVGVEMCIRDRCCAVPAIQIKKPPCRKRHGRHCCRYQPVVVSSP